MIQNFNTQPQVNLTQFATPHLNKQKEFIMGNQFSESALQEILKGEVPIQFDWQNRWLKGDEYAHILNRMEKYQEVFDFKRFNQKTHPESIYIKPQNGMIYFVKGNSIGSDFGFPRLAFKKKYKWKKMNFTTDLPKKDPIVSYIVASAVKCEKFFPGSQKEGPVYRMHAVILTKRSEMGKQAQQKVNCRKSSSNIIDSAYAQGPGIQNKNEFGVSRQINKNSQVNKWAPAQNATKYILCHVRKVNNKKDMSLSDDTISDLETSQVQTGKISVELDMLLNNNNQRKISDSSQRNQCKIEDVLGNIQQNPQSSQQFNIQPQDMKKSQESKLRESGCSMTLRRRATTDSGLQFNHQDPDKNNNCLSQNEDSCCAYKIKQKTQNQNLEMSISSKLGSISSKNNEGSDYLINDSQILKVDKKRFQKLFRKNTNVSVNSFKIQDESITDNFSQISKLNSQKSQIRSPDVARKFSAQILEKNNSQDLISENSMFAKHYSLQKRAKNEDFQQFSIQNRVSDDKISQLQTNTNSFSNTMMQNTFNFTESLSKMTISSPYLNPMARPFQLESNHGFRKNSDIIGDRDRPSAFKKVESLKSFPMLSQNLLLKSPQVIPQQFHSPFNSFGKISLEKINREPFESMKIQHSLFKSFSNQEQSHHPLASAIQPENRQRSDSQLFNSSFSHFQLPKQQIQSPSISPQLISQMLMTQKTLNDQKLIQDRMNIMQTQHDDLMQQFLNLKQSETQLISQSYNQTPNFPEMNQSQNKLQMQNPNLRSPMLQGSMLQSNDPNASLFSLIQQFTLPQGLQQQQHRQDNQSQFVPSKTQSNVNYQQSQMQQHNFSVFNSQASLGPLSAQPTNLLQPQVCQSDSALKLMQTMKK
eukprot:403371324